MNVIFKKYIGATNIVDTFAYFTVFFSQFFLSKFSFGSVLVSKLTWQAVVIMKRKTLFSEPLSEHSGVMFFGF